jgi:hypothetical protein
VVRKGRILLFLPGNPQIFVVEKTQVLVYQWIVAHFHSVLKRDDQAVGRFPNSSPTNRQLRNLG